MPNNAETHITEWAELIGDSVPDTVQEERDESGEDHWNVGR